MLSQPLAFSQLLPHMHMLTHTHTHTHIVFPRPPEERHESNLYVCALCEWSREFHPNMGSTLPDFDIWFKMGFLITS